VCTFQLNTIGECWPFGQLHHQRTRSTGIFESVDRSNVGVIERGENFGFALESRHAVSIPRKRFWQDLNGYIAAKFRITGTVNLTHPARTNSGENFVRAQTAAGERRHEHQPAWNLSLRKTRCTYTMGTVAKILHHKRRD
jgi:hypothetical protein